MGIFKSGSFKGGVHPKEFKELTEDKHVKKLPSPPLVVIPVQQHIGAPSKPIVEPEAMVKIGDPVSESTGFVSVPSHASVSGRVVAVEEKPHPLGPDVLSIVIENDGQDTWNEQIADDEKYPELDKSEIRKRIQNAGLAGMGGAAFPTHVKLSPPADKSIDSVIINGAECEPYLTADHRLMLEAPKKIVLGLQIMVKVLGAKNAAIGIENNKADAIHVLKKTIVKLKLPYEVISLHVKYPQGAEKQLIKALTKREVPCGGLPMDVGCVVHNVGTAAAIYEAVAQKRPLIERIVTVAGKGVAKNKNLMVRIGTPFSDVFEACGGLTANAGKIIMGGPMMGLAQFSLDAPVIKGTSGLLVLDKNESVKKEEQVCISCAHCVDACPMGLLPKMLGVFVKHERYDDVDRYNVLDCIECGSCAYVCPSNINLVHLIRFGKVEVMKRQKKAG